MTIEQFLEKYLDNRLDIRSIKKHKAEIIRLIKESDMNVTLVERWDTPTSEYSDGIMLSIVTNIRFITLHYLNEIGADDWVKDMFKD